MTLLIISVTLFASAYVWSRLEITALLSTDKDANEIYWAVTKAIEVAYFSAVACIMIWIMLHVYQIAMTVAL